MTTYYVGVRKTDAGPTQEWYDWETASGSADYTATKIAAKIEAANKLTPILMETMGFLRIDSFEITNQKILRDLSKK